ncbi:uncharacterized protein LTR77_006231 [Saxophila tyrrhenica]|uniref:Chitin synthesis regulation, resistance to congo red-domain-containing protein n=1 Tax=Saxophila tyrrhenica TaxID=1690608 RepID=A0AAV9PAC3_9PEZI|nr:hypothetical protein LTR77_006231 [Saxophila tyrrhenica]
MARCDGGYNYYGGCYSTWDAWARWVVLGVVIFGAIFIFFLFSCISARRRRKRGYTPYRGTAWAAGRTPPGHAPAQYNSQQPYYSNNQQNYQPPPPAYGASQDYYSRQNDVELQQPPQAYGTNSRDNSYAPPPGPPPQKNDGIVR